MNVESKLLVRYGIPGWYFVFSLFVISKIIGIDIVKISGISSDVLFSVVITVIGVPIGYILYQIYFLTTHKKNKNETPDWNVFVYKSVAHEDREYVNGRYAHMLRGIHEIGVLKVTFIISGFIIYIIYFLSEFYSSLVLYGFGGFNLVSLLLSIFKREFFIMLFFTLINLWLAHITKRNYKFKQSELEAYMSGIKKGKQLISLK
ncbi:hypothetical protein [Oceanobacillus profundus]|uniref:hypothetical protein n=1 Tax=Oceanobacillus TaxID=182709 RepID=UPI0026E4098D|nr:hypothetical protein [Oceanobacillus profundus]MDO6448096.1 hypothetical protein [Oceanobacillus profundus]